MSIPMRQSVRIGAYLAKNKVMRRKMFPLIVELEPLFACNLACPGCGKIQFPTEILRQRVSVEQAVAAMEECGAPMVSIAGGEPLLHPDIDRMVGELVRRKKFVYLCTNGVLLRRKLDLFKPSPYFSFAIHIDGLRERHDIAVDREGVFDEAVACIREAMARGFRVTTNTTFFNTDTPQTVREVLDFLNDDLKVDAMMISPGTPTRRLPTKSTSYQPTRRGRCSPRRSPTAGASVGGSTIHRCSSTSSKARSTSNAHRGAFPATRCSAGSARAT